MTNMMTANESVANTSGLPGEYIRIGDMSKQFDVTLRTLRFYEDKGLINPRREGKQRLYNKRDVTRLKLILLGTRIGFSLREIKYVMDLYDPQSSNTKQLRILLDKSERQLVKLEKQMVELEGSIDELKNSMSIWRSVLESHQPSAITA